jgi:hypothetical protein
MLTVLAWPEEEPEEPAVVKEGELERQPPM